MSGVPWLITRYADRFFLLEINPKTGDYYGYCRMCDSPPVIEDSEPNMRPSWIYFSHKLLRHLEEHHEEQYLRLLFDDQIITTSHYLLEEFQSGKGES